MGLYNRLLQRCELNPHTTEAAAGALQNITAGDRRVRTHVALGTRRGMRRVRSSLAQSVGAGWTQPGGGAKAQEGGTGHAARGVRGRGQKGQPGV